jgi:uncharacterized spore protein YtfJ
VFIFLLITLDGCRSVKKTTVTRTIDTLYRIAPKTYKNIQLYVDNSDTIRIDREDVSIKLYGIDEESSEKLKELAPKIISEIELKERLVNIKAKEEVTTVEKENDNPIKSFFMIFGIICLVGVIVYIAIKALT